MNNLLILQTFAAVVVAAPNPILTKPMNNVLSELATMNPLPIEQQMPHVARELPTPADAVLALLSRHRKPVITPVADVWHFKVPTDTGGILVRGYRGVGAPKSNSPALIYFHGGGWVIGSVDTYDASCRALANLSKCVVYSVAYRQAPEFKFPAAHDDAYHATKWIMANASKQLGDPKRIAIGGESAGGNLALATMLRLKREGHKLPVHTVAIYSVADSSMKTQSYREHAKAKPLNAPMMEWFFKHYFRTEADGDSDYISLVNVRDWSGSSPTTVVLAQVDPLRSEGQMLANRLNSQRVPTMSREYRGVTHEFFGMSAVVPEAKEAQNFVASRLMNSWKK